MDVSYLAGLFDGDGSIFIAKVVTGYQIKVELSQCNFDFIKKVNNSLNNKGKIYEDKRHDKYTLETNWKLRFFGDAASEILHIMNQHAIIKQPQAALGIQYLLLQNKQNKNTERETIYIAMKALNANKTYTKPFDRVNNAYISGLFDAEGNVYINQNNNNKFYVKITQRTDIQLLIKIQDFLGYGKISKSEPDRLRFYSKADVFAFYSVIEDTSHIKIYKMIDLMTLLI
jgi:hypothetical protein